MMGHKQFFYLNLLILKSLFILFMQFLFFEKN